MNKKQADWIVKKLCPFILREEGRGFAMSHFRVKGLSIRISRLDEIEPRTPPSCGTVGCICGSIAMLRGHRAHSSAVTANGAYIGLDADAAAGLFIRFDSGSDQQSPFHWPLRFARRYKKAKTPLAKAKVAVALLHEVARTRGKILDSQWKEKA